MLAHYALLWLDSAITTQTCLPVVYTKEGCSLLAIYYSSLLLTVLKTFIPNNALQKLDEEVYRSALANYSCRPAITEVQTITIRSVAAVRMGNSPIWIC